MLAPLIPLSLDRVDQPFADAMVPIIESQQVSQPASQSVTHSVGHSVSQMLATSCKIAAKGLALPPLARLLPDADCRLALTKG